MQILSSHLHRCAQHCHVRAGDREIWLVWSGTSFSTPHVSGVAALIWSKYPGKSNLEVRKAMKATARDLGEPGKDWFYGHGLVRAKAALDYLGSH